MQKRRPVVTSLGRRLEGHRLEGRRRFVRTWVSVAVAGVVIASDQLTKTWAVNSLSFGVPRHVVGTLSWNLTINTGAAFSLGTGITPILEVVAVVLITVLGLAALRAGRSAPWAALVAIGLMLGGALSNLGDRLFRSHHGGVIDFIDAVRVGDHDRWPIFNVADASITVGAILLVLAGTRRTVPDRALPGERAPDTQGSP